MEDNVRISKLKDGLNRPLSIPNMRKFLHLLENINEHTWDKAHSIIVDGHATLWNYMLEIDPSFPRSVSYNGGWDKLPNKIQVLGAFELARSSVNMNRYLFDGDYKPVVKKK